MTLTPPRAPGPGWPAPEDLHTAFEAIFARAFYTNHGPLEHALDAALAQRLGVRHAVSVGHAGSAAMLALRALGVTGELLAAASAAQRWQTAIAWAGCRLDTLDGDDAPAAPRVTPATTALLCREGPGIDLAPWQVLARARGLRWVVDASAALAADGTGRRQVDAADALLLDFDRIPGFGRTGAGAVATDDDALAARLRATRSFHDTEAAHAGALLRLNAKLSEAQAAMVLAALGKP